MSWHHARPPAQIQDRCAIRQSAARRWESSSVQPGHRRAHRPRVDPLSRPAHTSPLAPPIPEKTWPRPRPAFWPACKPLHRCDLNRVDAPGERDVVRRARYPTFSSKCSGSQPPPVWAVDSRSVSGPTPAAHRNAGTVSRCRTPDSYTGARTAARWVASSKHRQPNLRTAVLRATRSITTGTAPSNSTSRASVPVTFPCGHVPGHGRQLGDRPSTNRRVAVSCFTQR